MAAIPYDVAEAFARGKDKRRGAFQSFNGSLFSYNLKLAHLADDGSIVLDHDLTVRVSQTTSRHIRALEAIIAGYTTCLKCGLLIDKDAPNKDWHPMCRVVEQINSVV